MTASSFGPKKQPRFAAGDAPDLSGNPTEVADYAAAFGNYTTGTTAEMNALQPDAWPGLMFWNHTTNQMFVYDGTAWIETSGVPRAANVELSTGWSMGAPNTSLTRVGRVVTFAFAATRNTPMTAGATIGFLPSGFRPLVEVPFVAFASGALQPAIAPTYIAPSGQIKVFSAGPADYRLISGSVSFIAVAA